MKEHSGRPSRFEVLIADKIMRRMKKSRQFHSHVVVNGLANIEARRGECCKPIPGDSIVGYVSNRREICIHRSSCRKFPRNREKIVDVRWKSGTTGGFLVRLAITSDRTKGVLAEGSVVLQKLGAGIVEAEVRTGLENSAAIYFVVEFTSTTQLNAAVSALKKIDGILSVERV